MNSAYYQAVDSSHSLAINLTKLVVDVVSARTWSLSFTCISVWLILSYNILWHREIFLVKTRFPFDVPWVISKVEHYRGTWCDLSWTIVVYCSFSNIVVRTSFTGEYSKQDCCLVLIFIHTLCVGAFFLITDLEVSPIIYANFEISVGSQCLLGQLDTRVSIIWWQVCC